MAKLSEKELAEWEKKRDLNAGLMQALQDIKRGEWARKTKFTPQPNGAIRRVILRRDGTIEKDEIIAAEKAQVASAITVTGLSQAPFAKILVFQYERFKGARQENALRSGCYVTESGWP